MKRFILLALLALASAGASAQIVQPSYQGLWWNAPSDSESGWGVNITHQGDILFATWFTYDADGKAMWLVVPNAQLQPVVIGEGPSGYGMGGMAPKAFEYIGTLYRTTGPAFDAASFDPSAVKVTPVGDADFRFTSPDFGTFTYTVNGFTGTKAIMRQAFSTMPTCDFAAAPGSFQDLWWRAPAGSESGWGLNIAQEGGIIFATWFTYDASGNGLWLVASNVRETSPSVWTGELFTTSGPAFNKPWDSTKVKVSSVGSITLAFDGLMSGTLTAIVNGKTVTKPITRESFATPVSTCR